MLNSDLYQQLKRTKDIRVAELKEEEEKKYKQDRINKEKAEYIRLRDKFGAR